MNPARDEAERRQLTILFCDLVGSTALSSELDPEDLRDVMRAYQATCQSAIERFDGHVARFMGDGVLAYFGYPRAHEDDAERSIRAGISLVQSVSNIHQSRAAHDRLRIRIGIATGPVVVGDIVGEGAAREHSAIGEMPNVAARLQALAAPGEILVAPLTRTLARGLFEFDPLGPQALKGLPEPLPVYRVRGERLSDSRFEAARGQALTPLVGREEELELLARRWERARAGQGQLVTIRGEAGIGKSRLADALRERIHGETHVRVLYQCSPHHVDSTLYPVVRQLEHASGVTKDDDDRERGRKLATVIASGPPVETHDAALLATLFGIEHGSLPPLAGDARRRRAMTIGALARQLEALARERPVLCVFEDLHWVDATTRELVERLVERIEHLPVLLALTHRPGFEHGWSGLAYGLALELRRMTRDDAARIATHVAGTDRIDPEVLATLVARGDGVPLYLEEMTRALVDRGRLAAGPGPHRPTSDAPTAVPPTLRDSLMARLDCLGAGKTVAQIGAVVGREFTRDLVARLCECGPDQVDAGLAELESAGIARPRRGAAETWLFKHSLVQEVAYESLLRRRRQQLHGCVADALLALEPSLERTGPELIAHHLAAAGDAVQALRWWDTAARRSVERGALEEAIGHLQRALTTVAAMDEGNERAATECGLRLRLAEALRVLERIDAAFEVLVEVESLATRHGLAAARARVHSMRGNLYFPRGETAACEREHAQALDWARRAGDRESEASALGGLGDASYVRGRFLTAGRHFERCVQLAREGGFPALEASHLPMLAVVRFLDLDMAAALAIAREGVEAGRCHSAFRPQMIAHAAEGFALFETGRLDEAEEALEATLALARGLGARRFEPVALGHLAKVHGVRGDRARAVQTAREAVAIARETAITFVGPRCYSILATVTDDETERERALADGEAVLAAGCVAHNHLHFYRDAIAVRLSQGRFDEVERCAGVLAAQFAEEPLGWSDYFVAWGRALAAHGRGSGGPDNAAELTRLLAVATQRDLHHPRTRLECVLRSRPDA